MWHNLIHIPLSQVFWFRKILAANQGHQGTVFLMKCHAVTGMTMCFGMHSTPLRHGTYWMWKYIIILAPVQTSLIQWMWRTLLTMKLKWNWSSLLTPPQNLLPLNKFCLSCSCSCGAELIIWVYYVLNNILLLNNLVVHQICCYYVSCHGRQAQLLSMCNAILL